MTYFTKIAIGFDQFINTLLSGFPDETISARAWRVYVQKGIAWPFRIINMIFFWQSNHCRGAYNKERNKAHFPDEYRNA